MTLPVGLYEQVISREIAAEIQNAATRRLDVETRELDGGDSHGYLVQHIATYLNRALQSFPPSVRLEKQVELANRVIDMVAQLAPDAAHMDDAEVVRAEVLLAIFQTPTERPDTPLSASCLMTGTRQDPSLVSQLRKEIATADRVDILCSFVKWSGVRILEDAFRTLARNGRSLRVITTSYMGATDLKAVDFLREIPGTILKVSYDTQRTRLHAKAYLIYRESGFSAAYIGSSNISQAALTDGLEWNVKISQHESPHLWAKVCATFETYWNDPEFASYSKENREQLRIALANERVGDGGTTNSSFFFDIKPYPFQQEVLDKLRAERELHGRHRNLIVAATGTGKTVIAAFDYARNKRATEVDPGKRCRLLFALFQVSSG
jgi:HKD family nuclease